MTRLRKLMLEELQRRNFSSETIRGYLGTVERFAKYFGKPPDRLGPDHIRQWQACLLHERKLAVGTVVNHVAALRFFCRRVLKRRRAMDSIPYPKYSHHRTPRVLSPDEVARLIEAAGNLKTLREYWRWKKPQAGDRPSGARPPAGSWIGTDSPPDSPT